MAPVRQSLVTFASGACEQSSLVGHPRAQRFTHTQDTQVADAVCVGLMTS